MALRRPRCMQHDAPHKVRDESQRNTERLDHIGKGNTSTAYTRRGARPRIFRPPEPYRGCVIDGITLTERLIGGYY